MADTPQNIEHFNRVVLKLLDLLYETFLTLNLSPPRKRKLLDLKQFLKMLLTMKAGPP